MTNQTGLTDDEWYLTVRFPLALRISTILCHSPRQQQLTHVMEAFEPFLKELHAHHRRSRIRGVK